MTRQSRTVGWENKDLNLPEGWMQSGIVGVEEEEGRLLEG